jgi:hypothetical protein
MPYTITQRLQCVVLLHDQYPDVTTFAMFQFVIAMAPTNSGPSMHLCGKWFAFRGTPR